MFGPPHMADGVAVGKDTVGAKVTSPAGVGDGPGETVHVGGRDCSLIGSAAPSGWEAKAW